MLNAIDPPKTSQKPLETSNLELLKLARELRTPGAQDYGSKSSPAFGI